jgi:uncharacterized membrane protein YtjA (UPF0391 family)
MLSWPLAFLIIALLAALLGFTGIAGPAAWTAKAHFALFLALFLASMTASRKRTLDDEHSAKEPK